MSTRSVIRAGAVKGFVGELRRDALKWLTGVVVVFVVLIVLSALGISLERVQKVYEETLPATVWNWLAVPVEMFRVSVIALLVVFVSLACFVAVLFARTRTISKRVKALQLESASKSQAPAVTTSAQKFRPLIVKDTKLDLEWHILKNPDLWLDDPTLASADYDDLMSLLAGPFHSIESCKAPLQVDGLGYEGVFKTQCPRCRTNLFRSALDESRMFPRRPFKWRAVQSVLVELQTLKRKDVAFANNMELERPSYWDWMLSVKTQGLAPESGTK